MGLLPSCRILQEYQPSKVYPLESKDHANNGYHECPQTVPSFPSMIDPDRLW